MTTNDKRQNEFNKKQLYKAWKVSKNIQMF